MLEKDLENRIKKLLQKNNIPFLKTHGNLFQSSGWADLLIFHNYSTYALELKTDFGKSKPKMLQVSKSILLKDDVICLFADLNNYKFIVKNIVQNKEQVLKHYSNKQIKYWKNYYEKTLRISKNSVRKC